MPPITAPPPPRRPEEGHKGTFGTVIVIGGSPTMLGAPALTASAAFRSGAGLVKLAMSPALLPYAIGIEPSATGIALPDDPDAAATAIDEADADGHAVLAVGPGMGLGDSAARLLALLLAGKRHMVIDADGLNLLAATGQPRTRSASREPLAVLTPHPGEFRRLAKPLGIVEDPTDPDARPAGAAKLAEAHGAVVVLKGRHTIVTDGTRLYRNDTGNVALATAGSGDVLTGCIAALMAQGMMPFEAAVLGTHLHGAAADLWAADHGSSGMVARDLAARLPDAFKAYRAARGIGSI